MRHWASLNSWLISPPSDYLNWNWMFVWAYCLYMVIMFQLNIFIQRLYQSMTKFYIYPYMKTSDKNLLWISYSLQTTQCIIECARIPYALSQIVWARSPLKKDCVTYVQLHYSNVTWKSWRLKPLGTWHLFKGLFNLTPKKTSNIRISDPL